MRARNKLQTFVHISTIQFQVCALASSAHPRSGHSGSWPGWHVGKMKCPLCVCVRCMCQDQFQPGLHFVRVRALHSSPCIQFRLCNSEPEEPSPSPSLVRPIPPPPPPLPPDTVRRYLCRLRFPAKCTSIIFMFAVHFTILVPGSFLENRFLPSSVGVPTGGTVTGIRQQQQRKDSRGHSGARAELGLGEVWFILIIFFFNLKSITDQFYQLFNNFFFHKVIWKPINVITESDKYCKFYCQKTVS